MKTKYTLAFASIVLTTLCTPFMGAFAQGSLTPPGAPAPTMKTLDQIEARIPISTSTYITQSGSYYLTTNLVVSYGDGVDIDADGVMLDLNGYTIRSTNASHGWAGVRITGNHRNIAIANGFIEGGVTNNGTGMYDGSGFDAGVYSIDGCENTTVRKLSVSGCYGLGIYLFSSYGAVVDSCTVRTVGSYGITAGTVESSTATDCGGTAINGTQVINCWGECKSQGYGISAYTVQGSYGVSYASSGIHSQYMVQNSYGYSSIAAYQAVGIDAQNGIVQNSYGYANSSSGDAYGILATTVNNSHGQAQSNGSFAYGIHADTIDNSEGLSLGSNSGTQGHGIYANANASNCRGESDNYGGGSSGVEVYQGTVNSCYGYCPYAPAGGGILVSQGGTVVNSFGHAQATGSDGIILFLGGSVDSCYGVSDSGVGIVADTIQNSSGSCNTGIAAIQAEAVQNCYGFNQSGYGIRATSVQSSEGLSSSSEGIQANESALNCYGSTSSGYSGMEVNGTALNCKGSSSSGDYGLIATTAIGCIGVNGGGYNGIGISGGILNTCDGAGVTNVVANAQYNMP